MRERKNKLNTMLLRCQPLLRAGLHRHASTAGRCAPSSSESLQHCYSLSTWFQLPEQGMQQHEILARCSAFPLLSPAGRLCFVTSAHSCCPWRYREYFPDAWLEFVRPHHCRYTLEIRAPDGRALCEYRLGPAAPLRHPTRDVAVLRLEDEEAARASVAAQFGAEAGLLAPLELRRGVGGDGDSGAAAAVARPQPIVFCGHFNEERFDGAGQDVSPQVPRHVGGREIARVDGRLYARTDEVLQLGMCGGPAVVQAAAAAAAAGASGEGAGGDAVAATGGAVVCVGALEGIVPPDFEALPSMAGAAACVPAEDVFELLELSDLADIFDDDD